MKDCTQHPAKIKELN